MKISRWKKVCVALTAILGLCLASLFMGGMFASLILPVLLCLAVLFSLFLCLKTSSYVQRPAAAAAVETDPPIARQVADEIQIAVEATAHSALGSEYRRSELKQTELAVDAILEACLKLIGSRIDAHTIAVLFPTNDKGFQIRRFVSRSDCVNKDAVIYPGVGVIGVFLKDGLKQLHLDEIVTDSITLFYYNRDAGIRSLMASPIVVAGAERGFIIADSTEKKHFTDEMHAYLSTMAEVLGAAVYHAYVANEHRLQYHHLVAMSGIEKSFFEMQDVEKVLDKMAEIIPFAFRCNRMTISLKEQGKETAMIRRAWGAEADTFTGMSFSTLGKTLAGILYTKNMALIRNYAADKYEVRYRDDEPQNEQLASLLGLPLGVDACKGLILLESVQRDGFNQTGKELLARLATSAGIAIEKIQILKQTESLATHDGLTGLNNHRQFQQLLKEAITRSIRYKDPLSLVICDLDHFKKINDTHGHRFGDVVLKSVAATLQSSIRADIDVAARYGGEEFALVLEKTDAKSAQETVERIRSLIASGKYASPSGAEISVTMSFGIAIYGLHAKNQEALIQKADKALYRAKNNGRNRAEMYMEVEG
jgi:two-component system cell cycle response regulator